MNNLEHTLKEAREDFDQCHSVTDLDQAKAKYLGKSGVLTEALKSLGKLSAEERPKVGAEINVVKQGVEEALEKRREAILNASQAKQLAEE
jgi:phenylalanyl-tRNA synthetase alpha chain